MAEHEVEERVIGRWTVPPVGLGTMPMAWEPMLDHRDRAIETIHAALASGIRLFDTANIYAPPGEDLVGYGESLLAEGLRTWSGDSSDVVVATKGGIERRPGGGVRNATAEHLMAACEASLVALGVQRIDIYFLHWPARSPSFAQQVENVFALRSAGLINSVGLSNINAAQLEVALDVGGSIADGGIVAVQNEFSPRFRENPEVMARACDAGVAFLPWSPFGGADRAHDLCSQYRAFADVASAHAVSAHQVALAWHLHASPNVIPIPGSTRPETIVDCAAAMSLKLSDEELDRLSSSRPEGTSHYPSDEPEPPLR